MITVKFFAQIREWLGVDSYQLSYADGMTMNDVLGVLKAQSPDWQQALESGVLMACNQALVDGEHLVSDNDELAFFPPVTGG